MYLPGSPFSSRTMLYEDCAALVAAEDLGARSLVVAGQPPWASIRLFGRMSVQFFSM